MTLLFNGEAHRFGAKKQYREPKMTATELSRHTGTCIRKIYYHIENSELSFTKVKNRKYYSRSELLAWYKELEPKLRSTPCPSNAI